MLLLQRRQAVNSLDKSTQLSTHFEVIICILGLFGFHGLSNFVSYLMPKPFYSDEHFYFKQFSLV